MINARFDSFAMQFVAPAGRLSLSLPCAVLKQPSNQPPINIFTSLDVKSTVQGPLCKFYSCLPQWKVCIVFSFFYPFHLLIVLFPTVQCFPCSRLLQHLIQKPNEFVYSQQKMQIQHHLLSSAKYLQADVCIYCLRKNINVLFV